MKIPNAKHDPQIVSSPKWTDIICDKCGKSCRDSIGMNFEYATIRAHWGFGSGKDTETHEAQVCESCYDGLGLKPKISNYL